MKFNTLLDRDIAGSKLSYDVTVYHKNGKVAHRYNYSSSFTIQEIYKEKNKDIELEVITK